MYSFFQKKQCICTYRNVLTFSLTFNLKNRYTISYIHFYWVIGDSSLISLCRLRKLQWESFFLYCHINASRWTFVPFGAFVVFSQEKAKPAARQGRKITGLIREIAGLP